MLFQLGGITIDSPAGLNATATSEEFGSDFAIKPIVGAAQSREFVGEADSHRTISGRLLPFRAQAAGQATGLEEIEYLRGLASTGEPQILVRGDGTNFGWWLVERVGQSTRNLGSHGIGRDIDYAIALVKSQKPASGDSMVKLLRDLLDSM